MFEGHDPYLVALSVAIAILGGYTGFGLTARIRGTPDASHRLLLAGAAFFLAIGIWTMHFVGMLAAPLPAGTVYLVLPTVISFLICVLVVGISLFFVSIGEPSMLRVLSSAVLLGVGIASMHYVGMHGLAGDFAMTHDPAMVVLSVADRDRHRLRRNTGVPRAPGRRSVDPERRGVRHRGAGHALHRDGGHASGSAGGRIAPPHRGLAASSQMLSLVVTLLCFVIAAGFLLSLVPDPRKKAPPAADAIAMVPGAATVSLEIPSTDASAAPTSPRLRPTPLGGIGQPPRAAPAPRLPVEGADGTHFIDSSRSQERPGRRSLYQGA